MTALRRLLMLVAAAGLAGAWARRRAESGFPALPTGPPMVDAEVVEEPAPVVPAPAVFEPEPEPTVAAPDPDPPEPPAPAPPPPMPDPLPPAAGPEPPAFDFAPPPPPPDVRPRLKPLPPPPHAIAPVEYPTAEMDAVELPVEEGEPRVSAMPPVVGDPIDLAPEGDVIVTAVTETSSVTDAMETALDAHVAPPDAEEYAYAAGLTEPVTIPGVPEPEPPLEDEYAHVEMAEPEASQPGSDSVVPAEPESPQEAEEHVVQEPPEAASEAPPVDIVTVVDDLLGGPPEVP